MHYKKRAELLCRREGSSKWDALYANVSTQPNPQYLQPFDLPLAVCYRPGFIYPVDSTLSKREAGALSQDDKELLSAADKLREAVLKPGVWAEE